MRTSAAGWKKSLLIPGLLLFALNIKLSAQEQDKLNSLLALPLNDLLNTEITTAGKKMEKAGEIPASVVIVTREEIERYGYSTLDELLANILGMYVYDTYHPLGKVSVGIRGYTTPGGGNENIVILVNGVNQVDGIYGQYLLPKIALSVELIDRIEVIKGPMSVIYGNGAFFGAINIITNDPERKGVNLIQGSYGTYNSNEIVAKISRGNEDYRIIFNASRYSTDGIDNPYSDMMSNPASLKSFGLPQNATIAGMLKDKRTYFNLSGSFSNFTFDIGHTEFERGGVLLQPSVDYSYTKMMSTNVMINYEKELSENLKVTGKLTYLSQTSEAYYHVNEHDSFTNFGFNSNAYEYELNAFIRSGLNTNVTLGLFHRNEYYGTNPFEAEAAWGSIYANSLTRLSENSSIRTNAFFAQGDYSPDKTLKIVAGFRLEQLMPFDYQSSNGPATVSTGRTVLNATYDRSDIQFIPRLALIYTPYENHIFKLLYGEAFRQPPLGQLADNILSRVLYKIPELGPAKMRTYELSYLMRYKSYFVSNFSIFRNELEDLIYTKYFTLADGTVVDGATNYGKVSTNGAEIEIKITPLDNLEFSIGGTYQKSNDETEGYADREIPYSPKFLGYLKAACLFPGNYTISMIANYIGEMISDYDIHNVPIGKSSDAYIIVGANISANDFLIEGLYISAKCSNIFDALIHYPVSPINSFADKGIPGPGRTLQLTLGYKF